MRSAYKVLAGKPERKRPLGRPKCRWDTIRMDLRETYENLWWIHLAYDRDQWWALVNAIMNVWHPQKAENFYTRSF
jgi:hypothetical protein